MEEEEEDEEEEEEEEEEDGEEEEQVNPTGTGCVKENCSKLFPVIS